MITREQKEKVMELLKEARRPLSTNSIRNKASIPVDSHASLRTYLNTLFKQGKVNRTNQRPFYWSLNIVTDATTTNPDVWAPMTVTDVLTLLAQCGLSTIGNSINIDHPMVFVLTGDTYNIRHELGREDLRYDTLTKQWFTTDPVKAAKVAQDHNLGFTPVPSKGIGATPAYNVTKSTSMHDTFTDAMRKANAATPTSSKGKAQPAVDNSLLDELKKQLMDLTLRIEEQSNEIKTLKSNRPIHVVVPTKDPKKVKVVLKERVHPVFEQVLFHISCGDNVMLVGPKGCGKTTLAHQISKALKLKFDMLSLSGGVTEAKLLGRSIPNVQTGENHFHFAPFARLFRDGKSLFLLDEIDGGDPNVLLCLNSALANGKISIDVGNEDDSIIERGEGSHVMAAANTWGTGANRKYVGRNAQDTAFTDRFVQIAMDYDKEMELVLCPGQEEMVEKMHAYRKRMEDNRIERELGTRQIVRFANWLNEGKDMPYVEKMLFGGWTDTEINKVKF